MPEFKTHESFKKELNKVFPEIELLSIYERSTKPVIVRNKYGICKTWPQGLINGHAPTIKTAISKTEYFKKLVSEIHNNKYIYDKTIYTGVKNKVIITCPIHGDFEQMADKHIQKRTCPKCARISTTQSARNQATGWKYSDWENAGKSSKNFDCFRFYICKLENDEEMFYKIGKTFNTFIKRFDKHNIKYKITELYSQCGFALYISQLENYLKNINKEHKYLPKQVFGGMHECFSEINDLEEIISNPSYWDKVFLK